MIKTRLFKRFFILLFIVGLLNLAAETLYLYWSIWWFDSLIHFLAGGAVAMASVLVYEYKLKSKEFSKIRIIMIAVASSIIVGILWEIYELYFGITFLSDGIIYIRDTSSDLLMDICGGFFGALYAYKLENRNTLRTL